MPGVNYFLRARNNIRAVSAVEDRLKNANLHSALRLSCAMPETDDSVTISAQNPPAMVMGPNEIAESTELTLDQLVRYNIVLTRIQAMEYFEYRQVVVDEKEFKRKSGQQLYRAYFRRDVSRVDGGRNVYTFAEMFLLVQESATFRLE